jgi:hypothetical protein
MQKKTPLPDVFRSASILPHQPAIILSAIYDVIHIYNLILNLIQNQIPFFNEPLVILIRRNKFCIQKRIVFLHPLKRTYSLHQFVFVLRAASRLFSTRNRTCPASIWPGVFRNKHLKTRCLFHFEPRQ